MPSRADAIRDSLSELAEGLSFPSEIDAPVAAVGPIRDATALDVVRHLAPGAPLRPGRLDDFFGTLTDPESDFAENEPEAHRRFRAIEAIVGGLDGVEVHYAGDSRALLFVLGQAEPGVWVGLSADVLET